MSEQDASFDCRPGKDFRVGSRAEANVLHAHDVQVGASGLFR